MPADVEPVARIDDSAITAEVTGYQPVLELRGISKPCHGVKALENVGLILTACRVTALIGENGAGKSTLVKILTGIYQPDAGEIRIDRAVVQLPTAQAAQRAGV